MGDTTGISWCDSTLNPWIGCEKVSPACAHCYAETLVTGRMNRPGTWGADGTRQRTSEGLWRKPLVWERDAAKFAEEHAGRRRRVFCASLADVFEPRPELEPWRNDLFRLIEDTPSLDWLLLTKRPEEARDYLAERYARICSICGGDGCFDCDWSGAWGEIPAGVWIGASVENIRWTWRADVLRQIPATVRFLSCEPLLGSLFSETASSRPVRPGMETASDDASEGGTSRRQRAALDLTGIDWVIGGGESGGHAARPTLREWAYELRDACVAAGIPFHWKQWGSHGEDGIYRGRSPKASGKLVAGVDWCEFPRPRVAA